MEPSTKRSASRFAGSPLSSRAAEEDDMLALIQLTSRREAFENLFSTLFSYGYPVYKAEIAAGGMLIRKPLKKRPARMRPANFSTAYYKQNQGAMFFGKLARAWG